jgi:hypothetical protein
MTRVQRMAARWVRRKAARTEMRSVEMLVEKKEEHLAESWGHQ